MCSQDKQNEGPASAGPAPRRIASVQRNAAGQLLVQVVGGQEPVVDARIARCFPWSLPQLYISVRDSQGKEIALLETLEELDEASRQVVSDELESKVFSPKISQVLSHKSEFGITSIRAETDRGEVTFQIRNRDDVRVLSANRALFRDVDGTRYEVADLSALDPASRKHLAHYF